MKNNKIIALMLLSMVSVLCGSVFGGFYQTDTIEYTAGSGSKSATIVIDFDLDNYFVFEYQWDDLSVTGDEDATGWDALDALNELSNLSVDSGSYQMPVEGVLMTLFYVNDFEYPGGQKYDYFDDGSLGWGYLGSTDNENWEQNSAVSLRNLTDGCWDSWIWTNHDMDNMWLPIRKPGQAPIPEPGSLMILSLGGLFLARKK